MAAQPEDYFQEVGTPGSATYMTAPGYASGATTINVQSTAGFSSDTGVIFAVDTTTTVNGVETQVPGSYCIFEGKVASSTSLSGVSLLYGTPQNYPAGATTRVYITVSSQWVKRLVEGLLVSHTQSGTLKDGVVGTANIANNAVNSNKVDFGGAGAGIWWEEIARTTVSSPTDTITVSSIPARKYLKILCVGEASSGVIDSQFRFNNDSSALYRSSYQVQGSPGTSTDTGAVTSVPMESGTVTDTQLCRAEIDIINVATKAKIFHWHNTNNTSASAMTWLDGDGRWANTTNLISRFDWINTGIGDFGTNSEVIVLGHN